MTEGAEPAADVAASGPDLRLLLPALAAWGSALWAVAEPPSTVTAAAVGVAVLAGVGGAALVQAVRSGPGGVRWVPRGAVASLVLVLAVAGTTLACAALRLTAREAGPLPGWVREGAVAELEGTATGDPQLLAAQRFPGPARVGLALRADRVSVGGRESAPGVPVLVLAPAGSGPGAWSAVTAGQRVRFRGRLAATEPGDDAAALVSARGAPGRIEPGSWPWRLADRIRAGLREACRGLDADSAGLLPSLVVGDTSALPARLRADLRAAGLTHLTAVSGANLAIAATAVTVTVAAAGAGRRARLALAVLAVAAFVILARPSPSVLRAAGMAAVALAGLASARRPRGLPVLASAVVLLLAWDPWLARNPGFALSTAATGGLLLLAPVWAQLLARRMPRPLAVALAAPAAAQAACGPVLVLVAPSVSPVAIPANLLAEPAVAPATLLGLAAAALSPLWPIGARFVARVGSLATDWIALVAHRGAAVPGGTLPWQGGVGGATLLALLTAALVQVSLRRRDRPRHRPAAGRGSADPGIAGAGAFATRSAGSRRGRAVRLAALVAVVVVVVVRLAGPAVLRWLPLPRPGVPSGWAVVLCDVGQGDALALRTGVDRAVLVDTGPAPDPVDGCLRRLGVRHLDLAVITHFHADHAFGLPGALRGRDVGALWVSPLQEPAANAEAVRRWAGERGVSPVQAWAGARGGAGRDGWAVRWRVLEPREPPVAAADTGAADGSSVNESSVALVVDVDGPGGGLRLLDLGDLETERQDGLAARLGSGGETLGGPVDVVKVAHHGSSRQSAALYAASGARLGLIGVGAGNDYGHPTAAALSLLTRDGIRVARTDLGGDLVVEPFAAGLRLTSLR